MSVFFFYSSADITEQSKQKPKNQGTKGDLFGAFKKGSVWKHQKMLQKGLVIEFQRVRLKDTPNGTSHRHSSVASKLNQICISRKESLMYVRFSLPYRLG